MLSIHTMPDQPKAAVRNKLEQNCDTWLLKFSRTAFSIQATANPITCGLSCDLHRLQQSKSVRKRSLPVFQAFE